MTVAKVTFATTAASELSIAVEIFGSNLVTYFCVM